MLRQRERGHGTAAGTALATTTFFDMARAGAWPRHPSLRVCQEITHPILAADERGWTPIRKREQNSFIGVHPRSSAAGSAFANFSGCLLALGKMFSYVLALSEDWSGCLPTSP